MVIEEGLQKAQRTSGHLVPQAGGKKPTKTPNQIKPTNKQINKTKTRISLFCEADGRHFQ